MIRGGNAGEPGEKQPHNFVSCTRGIRGRLWSNSIILPRVSRISLCLNSQPTSFKKKKMRNLYPYLRYYILKFIHALSFLVRWIKENAENIEFYFSRETSLFVRHAKADRWLQDIRTKHTFIKTVMKFLNISIFSPWIYFCCFRFVRNL